MYPCPSAPDLVYLQRLLLNGQLSFVVSVVVVSRTLVVRTVLNVVSYFTSLLIHMTRFVDGDEKFGSSVGTSSMNMWRKICPLVEEEASQAHSM